MYFSNLLPETASHNAPTDDGGCESLHQTACGSAREKNPEIEVDLKGGKVIVATRDGGAESRAQNCFQQFIRQLVKFKI